MFVMASTYTAQIAIRQTCHQSIHPRLAITDSDRALDLDTYTRSTMYLGASFLSRLFAKNCEQKGPFAAGCISILSSCNGYVKGIGEKGEKGVKGVKGGGRRDRRYPQRKSSFLLSLSFLPFLLAAEPEGTQVKPRENHGRKGRRRSD